MNWWQRLWSRDRLETELDAELRFHVERLVEENRRRGLSSLDAHRQARLEFGGLDQVKEECRDARGTRWVEDFARDLRYAVRLLGTHRSFLFVATVVLALGIGVNGMFLTMVEMICIRGLPLERVERVIFIGTQDARGRDLGMSYEDFMDLRDTARSFRGLAAFASGPMALSDEGHAPDRFQGAFVSANTFRVAGIAPSLGRDFRADDDRIGADPVVIIGAGAWQARYAADASIIGKVVRVNGIPSTVIGVMPARVHFPTNADVWQPLALMPDLDTRHRDVRALGVFGRLRDDVSVVAARAETESIASHLARSYTATNRAIRMTLIPINERFNGKITDPAWLAFITAAGLVLVIACANLANLLLMRSSQRSREIAIRLSIGATRARIVSQLLAESGVIAVLGGILGAALAAAGLRVVASFTPAGVLPYWMDFSMNARVFTLLAVLCVGTTFVFGLLPALFVSKTDVNGVLKDGGRIGGSVRPRRLTAMLLAAQFALALLLATRLTTGARLLAAEQEKDPYIDMSALLTASVTLPARSYRLPHDRIAFYERLEAALRETGSIASGALSSALPFGGAMPQKLVIDGISSGSGSPEWNVWVLSVSPGYFETLGLPIIRGRAFTETDGTAGHENVVVNQRFVDMYLPAIDPLGRRIQLVSQTRTSPARWCTIVGVSPSVRQRPRLEPDPIAYVSYRAEPPLTAALIVRGSSDPSASAQDLRKKVRALDPDLPLYRLMTMEQAIRESRWNSRTSSFLVLLLTCTALAFAAAGLYAVMSYSVVLRTREIGVRLAMGAQRWRVASPLLKSAAVSLGVGVAAGLAFSFAWDRLFGGPPALGSWADSLNVVASIGLLATAAIVASFAPVRRASSIDPLTVLRHE